MMSAVALLRRARRIPGHRWAAIARVFPVVAAVRVGLWVLPYRHVDAATRPVVAAQRRPDVYARRTVWAAERVGGWLLRDRACLTQALAARWILGRAGYPAEVRIGGRRDEGGAFKAHAWLVFDGRIVVGGADSAATYVAMEPIARTPGSTVL